MTPEDQAGAADLHRQAAEARARAAEYYRQADERSLAGQGSKAATRCELAQLALASADRLLREAASLEAPEPADRAPGDCADPADLVPWQRARLCSPLDPGPPLPDAPAHGGVPMDQPDAFAEAQERVKTLARRPSNDDLLALYGLYKQATEGDARGSRPGLLDPKGRAKWDAWAARRGTGAEDAKRAYVALVGDLVRRHG
jgi:acyl-CoA-binding protein